ncbi:MAG: sialidase [Verrucomicrobia bacterium 61-8]|nr:sialidase [Verrucomicrobiota bacterium]OJV15699.1 MAG: sialidase [Verrucomicrobia bacterium 61-8]
MNISDAFRRGLCMAGLLVAGSLWADDLSATYDWKPLKIGGGGWVTGMEVRADGAGPAFARTDVSGAYRWEPSTSTWRQIVTDASMPAEAVAYGCHGGVDSLVAAPGEPDVAYMAFRGQIYRSANRGDTWVATHFASQQAGMEPNGEGRLDGERLAVDPRDSRVVFFGSISSGLWRTGDAGATWRRVEAIPKGTEPHGVNTVVFDPSGGTVKAEDGTERTRVIYVTSNRAGVFRSEDGGATWKDIASAEQAGTGNVRDAAVGPDGAYYVLYDNDAGRTGAVWKRSPEGAWTDITPTTKEGGSKAYYGIAVDPKDAQRLALIVSGGQFFASTDQGATWSAHGFQYLSPTIQWLGKQENYWLSVGEIAFDASGELWLAEGFGVWHARDLSTPDIAWQAASEGIEETCGNDVIAPPGGKPLGAMWDVGVFRFDEPDAYTARRAVPYFMSAWSLDWCPADPQFVAAVFRNHLGFGPHVNEAGFSPDGGITWTIFPAVKDKTIPGGLEYGTIAISAASPDCMAWAPVQKVLPYFTRDRGVTWQQARLGDGLKESGTGGYFGPQKPLCADRVTADRFYYYHTREGFFRSEDGGATFVKTAQSPPLGRVNSILKSVPGHAGHLLFAEGSQGNPPVGGLWLSEDGGESWSMLPGIAQAFNVGLGKPEREGGYPAIYVAGVAAGATGIYRSTDAGKSWDRIGQYPLGIFDWIDAMDGDKDVFGKVYIAFSGAGFAYGEPRAAGE